jgi:hypothetical protein
MGFKAIASTERVATKAATPIGHFCNKICQLLTQCTAARCVHGL